MTEPLATVRGNLLRLDTRLAFTAASVSSWRRHPTPSPVLSGLHRHPRETL
jgi:hypothetical protein